MSVLSDRGNKGAGPHELVAGRQVWPPGLALLRSGDELPTALAEKTMIGPGDELSAIGEADAEGVLDDAPVRENALLYVAAVRALAAGAVYRVADLEVADSARAAVGPQHPRVAMKAVDAPVLASPVRIDRAVEADVGRVVVRDDRARALDRDLRLEGALILFFRRPAVVEAFARDGLEAPLHEGARAAHMERVFAAGFALAVFGHDHAP